MQQVVTITGLSTKTGENDSGGWTLYLFETAGGTKFQTFDDDLGATGSQNIGKAVDIEFEAQERHLPAKGDRPATTVTNNVIKSIKATDKQPSEFAPSNDRDQKQRSKEEVRRTESVKAAATLMASPKWDGDLDLKALTKLADAIGVYAENGSAD